MKPVVALVAGMLLAQLTAACGWEAQYLPCAKSQIIGTASSGEAYRLSQNVPLWPAGRWEERQVVIDKNALVILPVGTLETCAATIQAEVAHGRLCIRSGAPYVRGDEIVDNPAPPARMTERHRVVDTGQVVVIGETVDPPIERITATGFALCRTAQPAAG